MVYNKHMSRLFTMIVRPDEESKHMSEAVRNTLVQAGFEENEDNPDIVIVIGGDGTFIFAIHQFIDKLDQVKFYGIHTGTLGFYTDYRSGELDDFLDRLIKNDVTEETYPLLQAETENAVYYGINEIRIENAARTQDMSIYVNGNHFENFRGTGICICTQLGSTAYNRSLGGAVIQEGLSMIELCEISGIHHSAYRSLNAPFVMRDDVRIDIDSESFTGALLGVDSEVYNMDEIRHITVRKADRSVHMLRGKKISYYDRLKSLF